MSSHIESQISTLVVDDDPSILNLISTFLRDYGYLVVGCSNAREALVALEKKRFDVVLADITMPEVSGIDLIEKTHTINKEIPVILMTGDPDLNKAIEAIKKGAFDFIVKPYNPEYLIHSLKKAVNYYRLMQMEKNYKIRLEKDVKQRTQELAEALDMVKSMNIEVVHRLTVVSEYRDTDTGAHIKRIGAYSGKLAEALDMPSDFVEAITLTSSMHDIGKVGISDNILLKPGPLTSEEFNIMKKHTTIGSMMLKDSHHPHLQMAATIALNHHERWDGTGYPQGLKGEETPIEGRITIIADMYDALRSKRPYKDPFSHEEACKIITQGDGRTKPEHLDPQVLKTFIEISTPTFDEIFKTYKD